MQKGNNAARTAHITLNVINLALFASQVPSGLEIVGKVRSLLSVMAATSSVVVCAVADGHVGLRGGKGAAVPTETVSGR